LRKRIVFDCFGALSGGCARVEQVREADVAVDFRRAAGGGECGQADDERQAELFVIWHGVVRTMADVRWSLKRRRIVEETAVSAKASRGWKMRRL
jgi:hypothetical protein